MLPPTATEFIDLALRAMAREVIDSHISPPPVVSVHLTSDIDRLPDKAARVPAPCPALVAV